MSTSDYFLDFTFKQTNLFKLADLVRYVVNYNPDTLFVIQGIETINKLFECKEVPSHLFSDGELSLKTRFVKGNRELFLRLCEERRNVHLLESVENHTRLKWLEAIVGSDLAILRRYLMFDDYRPELEDFDLKYDRPVTIIFAGYGMGKTTCLRQIKQNLMTQNKNQFILYLNDVKLRNFHGSVKSPNFITFIKFFEVDLTNPDVHIMYDNFECLKERDNIIDIMTDVHLNYRQIKQWITCSEIDCRNKLESKLGTFACFLDPITQDLQLSYLKNIWEVQSNIADAKIESLLDACNNWYWKNTCRFEFQDFCNYPLHLNMIALMFKATYDSEFCNVNILDLYEFFVKSVYSSENMEELAVHKLFERIKQEFKFRTDIQLTRVTLEFENVINYLAAKWFSKNFSDYQGELKILFESRCCSWSFQYFFNSFLCREMPLHTAVLNRCRIDYLLSAASVVERDTGGRTALHLADDTYLMGVLLTEGAQTAVKDDVLQWTPMQYCDYNGYLRCLELLLENNADLHQLTWTLNLSESEIFNRFEFACFGSKKLRNFIKFICLNVKVFQPTPEIIAKVFQYEYANDIPEDVKMMVLNRAKKSNIYYIDSTGKTALFYAVQYNHLDAVKYLINNLGFDTNHRCYEKKSPFHVACENGFLDIVEYLLELGVDINSTHGANNSNAFTDCCKNDNVQVMKYLVNKGFNTDIILECGETPLELACVNGSINVVKYLFKHFVRLNDSYEMDYEKLVYKAVKASSTELVEFLLNQNKKIDVNRKFGGKTMLHVACYNYWDYENPMVPVLIAAGADVNACDNEGCTPVFELLHSGATDAVEVLAENGCNFTHINKNGETPLHVFTKNSSNAFADSEDGYHELNYLLKYSLTYGADVNARTPSGDTPLHFASYNGNLDIINSLVLHGADIHVENNKGETALHMGCLLEGRGRKRRGISAICKVFVSRGADINKKANSGKTPIMYAVHGTFNIDALVKMGADIFCKDNDNRTLVHYFAEYGLLDNLRKLAKLGMKDAKSVDSSGQTALHFAVAGHSFPCFKYLINHFDTDVNIIDNNGMTAIDLSRCNFSKHKRERHYQVRRISSLTCDDNMI